MWYSEGDKTNPADETILADTGALSAGSKLFTVLVSANAATSVRIERRNAADDANEDAHVVFVGANVPVSIALPPLKLAQDERLRVLQEAALGAGRIQATIALL